MLVPSVGYCEYRCTLCGRVCPTGAVKPLSPGEKESVRIGTAFIDFGRCLPHAFGIPCLVCEEVCPTAVKAVWFESGDARDREGKVGIVKKPHVDPALCVGCGACEHNCPVRGEPAIRVVSTGETRSKENRLLL
jgi:formate hydrogenlyase subunit 6/NADH:ubiquinone oxidoreductase subunit I